jgi:hypothetical protein
MEQVNSVNTVKPKKGSKLFISSGFSKAYRSLPYLAVRDARKKITAECSWSRSLFDKKERGLTPFSNLEIRYIEDFFAQFNLNAWTGELINKN